jgi:hypothetical protein
MECTNNGTPMFDGQNYEIWSHKMKVFLQAHGFDVWKSVVTGYTTSKKPLKTTAKKELKRNNKIAMDSILDGLHDSVKVKVGQCSSTKEIWDKLHNLYFKESPLITEPKHVDQDKEDVEIEQEEISSSCQTDSEEEEEEEGEVDLEAELINALSEVKRERKKNKSLKEELIKLKEGSQNPKL